MSNNQNIQISWSWLPHAAPQQAMAIPIALGCFWALVAFAILMATVHIHRFHVDEVITLNLMVEDWSEIASNRIRKTHSPLYFWMLKPIYSLGPDYYVLRYPSVVFASLTIGVLVTSLSALRSTRVANIFALVLIFCPGWLFIGHYARPYAFVMFMISLSICSSAFLIAANSSNGGPTQFGSTWRNKIAYFTLSASTALAAATMMFGVLYVLALSLTPISSKNLRGNRQFLCRWYLALVPAAAVSIVLSYILMGPIADKVGDYWADTKYPLTIEGIYKVYALVFSSGQLPSVFNSLILLAATAFVGVAIVNRRRFMPLFLALAPACFFLPAIFILISLHTSIMVPRYFYIMAPALVALIALASDLLAKTRLGLAMLLLLAPVAISQGVSEVLFSNRMNQHASIMEAIVSSGSRMPLLIVRPHHQTYRYQFLYETEFQEIGDVTIVEHPRGDERLLEIDASTLAGLPGFWIVGRILPGTVEDLKAEDWALVHCEETSSTMSVMAFKRTTDGSSGMSDCR